MSVIDCTPHHLTLSNFKITPFITKIYWVVQEYCSLLSHEKWAPHMGLTMGPTPHVREGSNALGLHNNYSFLQLSYVVDCN